MFHVSVILHNLLTFSSQNASSLGQLRKMLTKYDLALLTKHFLWQYIAFEFRKYSLLLHAQQYFLQRNIRNWNWAIISRIFSIVYWALYNFVILRILRLMNFIFYSQSETMCHCQCLIYICLWIFIDQSDTSYYTLLTTYMWLCLLCFEWRFFVQGLLNNHFDLFWLLYLRITNFF